MIARGRSVVCAEIEFDYNILSQIVDEIPSMYQSAYENFIKYSEEEATSVGDGDMEIYSTILRNFEDERYRQEYLCENIRKILFCSIFSYYESMLKVISQYYHIALKENVKDIFVEIKNVFRDRYSDILPVTDHDSQYINEFLRLLRNYFTHGTLSDKRLRELRSYIMREEGIDFHDGTFIGIKDNDFLHKSLNSIKKHLINIESAFSIIVKDDFHQMNLAKDLVHQAIVNSPPAYPGLEEEFPPYCSIEVHRLLIKAEQIYLKFANRGDSEAQTRLANLYLVGFEMPDTDRGLYWLNMAVGKNYAPAITMLKEYRINT